jgi:thymidylate synthase ThyX
MDIVLIPQFNGTATIEDIKKTAQVAARVCYSKKDIDGLFEELYDELLVEGRLLKGGHHSPFEHKHLTFYMRNIPKMLAMTLNNERQCATSEKSARYTQMELEEEQQELYDKWLGRFEEMISREYPESEFPKLYIAGSDKKTSLTKLAQENARYVTSVFTPTKMVHTINARQINFIMQAFGEYIAKKGEKGSDFERRLASDMAEFTEKVSEFKVKGLENQTDRHLSMFREAPVEEYFGDVYATNYFLSFAGLAQAHRHRTIEYGMQTPLLGGKFGFYVPPIVKANQLGNEWLADLNKVAELDYPQAQLAAVSETGTLRNFRSKAILRLCSHPQYEIMVNTQETAGKYAKYRREVGDWIKPKCLQGMKCAEPCMITSKRALERIV